jgi:coenzyme F420-reducing hydrogenase beta subunit
MIRQNVSSSAVKSIGWENGKMEVEYNNGSVYQYEDTPFEEYQKARVSPSIGSMISQMGKKYPYKKI